MNKITQLIITLFFAILSKQNTIAQQIYTNGELSTGTTSISGVVVSSGYNWSELQNNTGNTTQTNGTSGLPAYFKTDGSISYQLADDFVVPDGETWSVTSFDFYLYEPIYAATPAPINQLRIQIFNTDPSLSGATPLFGDMTTNILSASNSGNAFIYRIFNSAYPSPGQVTNTSRKVYRVRGNIDAELPAGNYWVVFQAHPTDNDVVFFPPVTVVGSRSVVGANSKINVVASTVGSDVLGWANNTDIGIPNTAPDVALEIPFLINGSVITLNSSENAIESSIAILPNPVKEKLNVSISNGLKINTLAVYDLNGRVLKNFQNIENKNTLEIAVDELLKGVYFIKIISDKGIITKKIIKE